MKTRNAAAETRSFRTRVLIIESYCVWHPSRVSLFQSRPANHDCPITSDSLPLVPYPGATDPESNSRPVSCLSKYQAPCAYADKGGNGVPFGSVRRAIFSCPGGPVCGTATPAGRKELADRSRNRFTDWWTTRSPCGSMRYHSSSGRAWIEWERRAGAKRCSADGAWAQRLN